MLEFINNIADFVPAETLERFYGVCNKLVGLAKYTPRQADAFILSAEQLVDECIMSMPPWTVTNEFLLSCRNMVQVVKTQVWRATTLDARNERAHVATAGTMNEQRTPLAIVQRKKILGIF
jgi:hypothetical protein